MALRTLNDIGKFIFVNDEPTIVDAMLLPGGSMPELAEHAATLYRSGYAPLVIPSGKFSFKRDGFPGARTKADIYPGPYTRESAFFRDILERNGVPSGAILEEPEATFTIDNALKTRALLDTKGIRLESAMIVCKPFHARRALLSYELALPETAFIVCPFQDPALNASNWFETEAGRQRVMGELEKCGGHYLAMVAEVMQPNIETSG